MNTVVLCGAGCSVEAARAERFPRSAWPPTDASFLTACASYEADLRDVTAYLESEYGINLRNEAMGMESIFNIIYADAVGPDASETARAAYWYLLNAYRSVLTLTTNKINQRDHTGPRELITRLLTEGSKSPPVFITFNHDVVLEKAVESAAEGAKLSGFGWSLDTTYGVDFEAYQSFGGSAGDFNQELETSKMPIRILKLHGSLNWLHRVRGKDTPEKSWEIPEAPPLCESSRTIHTGKGALVGRDGLDIDAFLPTIVPPVYEKSPQYRSFFRPLWTEAREALEKAERLIVLGYSFPAADFIACQFLRRAVSKVRETIRVLVINPDRNSPSRTADVLSVKQVTWYAELNDVVFGKLAI